MNSDVKSSGNDTLQSDFRPGSEDVIIGHSRKYEDHAGNKELRKIVESKLDEYLALDKSNRSSLVYSVVRKIRVHGCFVKENLVTGDWLDAGEELSREKVDKTFCDALRQQRMSIFSDNNKKRKYREYSANDSNISGTNQLDADVKSAPPTIDIMKCFPVSYCWDDDPFEPVPLEEVFEAET